MSNPINPTDISKDLSDRDFGRIKETALDHFRMFSPDTRKVDNFLAVCYTHGVLNFLQKNGYQLVKKEESDGREQV